MGSEVCPVKEFTVHSWGEHEGSTDFAKVAYLHRDGSFVIAAENLLRVGQDYNLEVPFRNIATERPGIAGVTAGGAVRGEAQPAQRSQPAFDSPLLPRRMDVSYEARFGIINGSAPLLVVEPSLTYADVRQSNPFVGGDNVITLTIQTNFDVPAGSVLIVSNLRGIHDGRMLVAQAVDPGGHARHADVSWQGLAGAARIRLPMGIQHSSNASFLLHLPAADKVVRRWLQRAWSAALGAWREHAKELARVRGLLSRIAGRWQRRDVAVAFLSWRENADRQQRAEYITGRMLRHWTHRTSAAAFDTWSEHAKELARVRGLLSRIAGRWQRWDVAVAFLSWREKADRHLQPSPRKAWHPGAH